MTILLTIFTLLQAVGATVGAGGSVFAEIFYLRAIQDGRIDEAERSHLRAIAEALRYGMLILLVGSIGLVITDFVYLVPLQPALTSEYWELMALIFAVITSAWSLSRRKMTFMLGSAAIFTGWWLIAFLVFGRLPHINFGALVALYVLSTGVIAALLSYARMVIQNRLA